MKVLFLDFDGVLTAYPLTARGYKFDKAAMINLEMVLNKVPDLRIVVSSHRRIAGLEEMKEALQSNGIDPRKIIDITGHEHAPDQRDHRGYQIEKWLERNPDVKNFVILDDKKDFTLLKDRLVQTNGYVGFTQAKAEEVLGLLKEK